MPGLSDVQRGVNLRAWFGSPRYSEDLDVDASGVEPHRLASTVDQVLGSPPFSAILASHRLHVSRVTKPKQTDTTQRDLDFDAFRSQVVPYLAPDHQELFVDPLSWDRIRESVAERLEALGRT